MINDTIKTTGILNILLKDKNGLVKIDKTVNNLVVTVGKNAIASRLAGTTVAVMSHMAVGSGAASPLAGDTTLGTEIAASRTALSVSGGTVTTNTVTYATTFGAGVGTGAITEAGIFNATTSGTMLCRTSFAVVNKDVSDTLTISWAVTIS